MLNVSNGVTRGQSHEISNQIENACKAQGVNPEKIISKLIGGNFFFKKTQEYLLSRSGRMFPLDVVPQYLQPRARLLSVSATHGPYNENKWKNFLKAGIDNCTGNNWDSVISGCSDTLAVKIQPNDLIEDGEYCQFIRNEKQNFFQGIEQALQVVEDNPALVEEILKKDMRIHIPFMNALASRFVAYVFKYHGKLTVDVHTLSYKLVWSASNIRIVLFPQ